MTGSGAGRRRGPVAAALVALVVATAAPVAAAPSQAPAGPAGDPALTLTFQDLEVDPDGELRVLLEVADAPPGSDIVVDIHDRIDTVAGLAASTTAAPADIRDTFLPTIALSDEPVDRQPAGFTISLYGAEDPRPASTGTWAPYRLTEPGVYPLHIRLRAPDGAPLTSIVTYLVRRPAPDQQVRPSRVALLAAAHEPTAIDDPDAPGGEPVGPDLRGGFDAVLAALAAHPELPASFAVTPDTVARLAGDPAAAATLDALRAGLAGPGRELLGSPYVDVDAASLVANDLADELARQRSLGRRALEEVLGDPGTDTWLLDERLDPPAAASLGAVGVDRVVLPTSAVAGSPTIRPLPVAGAETDLQVLTTGFFDLTGSAPADPLLAGTQLLARLAATATIEPDAAVVVRIDPRRVDPDQLRTVLDGLARPSPFLRPVTVGDAFAEATPTARAAALARPTVEGLGRYPDLVRETHELLASYASMVPDRPDLLQAFERPLALSAADDLELTARRRILDRAGADLRDRFASIAVPERDRVTLGARDARFPLPVESGLEEPVRVVISLEASDRLELPATRIEATLTGDRTLVPIPVRTRATGDTPLRITVHTPDGRVLLGESRYSVRSTAVSGVGVVLTIGAAAFLALWWGRHWHRTNRERPGADPAAGGADPM